MSGAVWVTGRDLATAYGAGSADPVKLRIDFILSPDCLLKVSVTNLANGRALVVRVNDRGPFVKTRLIDVSHAAARQLGILEDGVAEVRVDVLADTAS